MGDHLETRSDRTASSSAASINSNTQMDGTTHAHLEDSTCVAETHQEKGEDGKIIIVGWDGEDDPENPQNWSTGRRLLLSVIATLVVLNITFASSAPSGLLPDLEEYFGFGDEVGTLTISMFVLGYSIGPILWGPLSERVGRKPVFLISLSLYTGFNIGCALSRNTASILIFRLLAGSSASAALSNSGGLIADLYPPKTRGAAMCVYAVAPFVGPSLGPIVGGFIQTSAASWRWLFWVLTMYSGFCIFTVVWIPETYAPVLLKRRAQRERVTKGDDRYKAPLELKVYTRLGLVRHILAEPFKLIIQEPMLLAIVLYQSYIFGVFYLLFEAFPIIFQQGHGLSAGVAGLTFIPFSLGGLTAVTAYCLILYPDYRKQVETSPTGTVAPEARLPMAMMGGPVVVIGCFWMAWTSYPSISLWAPLMATPLLGFGFMFIFGGLNNYLVDAYTAKAATALAASAIFRSFFGAAFPLFARQMYETLETQWATTLLGLLALLMVPIPFVLYKIGPTLRAKSKSAAADKA